MQVLLPGRTRQAIHSQASHLGVTVSNWSDQERQFLKDHHGIMPISKMASILGRSPEGARRMAYGMDPGKKKAKRPANPWTEQEMAILRVHSNQEAWILLP